MRFAFALVSLFPGGGLQRDCVDIARRVQALGHEMTIFTSRLSGDDFFKDLTVRILPASGRTNHGWQRSFSDELQKATRGNFDLVVGFDKLSGLDVLYCSDRSMRTRAAKKPILHLLPRYLEYINLEKECFAPNRSTQIMLLSDSQLNEYWSAWKTEPSRLLLLPPTLVPERRKPEYRADGTRARLRSRLGLALDDWVWIAVCVQPKTKGTDRTIRALSQFPQARLLIVGVEEHDTASVKIRRLARRLGVGHRIRWLGHHEDIPELMAAADLFIHPARYDTTGTVILESIVNGLPVITTSACGYAMHVVNATAGIVIPEPFEQRTLIAALETARDPACLERWSHSGSEYGNQGSLYEGRTRATEFIIARSQDADKAATGLSASP
jgi:UDP-glucose:(heptosyl)LPS alpha-1,3-glucosyltransferase